MWFHNLNLVKTRSALIYSKQIGYKLVTFASICKTTVNRKNNTTIITITSLTLAFLVIFPPVYQSIHSALLHQHHLSNCEHTEGELHQQETTCEIISFVFYTQALTDATPMLVSPATVCSIYKKALPLSPATEPVLILIPRAPPVSC